MLLEALTLCDFGLFRGEQVVDLNPRKKYGSNRPIILFGGLNGAGKTTILTAIRLAIYGRQALGHGVSTKLYEDFLLSKIHRNPKSLIVSSGSHIALDFVYYKLGKPTKYKITRSWVLSGKQIKESLLILQDGEQIREFTQEQCQAFLNELIPLGVSELFFFDGEKIASLADDGGDVALRDSIKKLLGLDVIERLKSDLTLYVRRQNSKFLPDNVKLELAEYELEYSRIKGLIHDEESATQHIYPKIIEEQNKLTRLEETLASKGGAWAVSRQSLKSRGDELLLEKKLLESEVREHLGSLYPLSLAPKLLEQVFVQLQTERTLKDWESTAEAVSKRLDKLSSVVMKYVTDMHRSAALDNIKNIFEDLVSRPAGLESAELLHDLSGKDYIELESWINEALSKVKVISTNLAEKLGKVDEELGNISLQIERAPDQETLQIDFDSIKQKVTLIAKFNAERNQHLEMARKYTWQAIEIIRKIKKLEEQLSNVDSQGVGVSLAGQTKDLLADFAEEMTKRKIAKLEKEFALTFSRLARKTDSLVRAEIDPNSFVVNLYSKAGKVIPKQDLSAGEKQIYAIAMLEALAKTSGRKLPIIIDTPLGRLDSHHREKLINNYFPKASHQVIILSTDTEVDQSFYEELSNYVSHSYHINYDEIEAASTIEEGYFWKSTQSNKEGIASAS